MKKLMVAASLLVTSASALAADIYAPTGGVVCDKKAGFCVDDEGISMGMTSKYLGEQVYNRLDKEMGYKGDVNMGEYTFSNGVHCDSEAKQCYKDRFYPRTPDKKENTLTQQIFGKASEGK
ncbi:YcgJ family protein [Trabulsiella odontotermitis]|uniref:Fels-1 prophage-like protein n=1 Tax=Trabulsiella odontotermitis TaxID=379893 RepID=A0A0L0GTI1_9ENTR|nr:YcgJ family protein [Trabulsiella odontotermitis]KNC92272.1 hypothetical protein GM31_00120 [Trabulsiella odontotermitis]